MKNRRKYRNVLSMKVPSSVLAEALLDPEEGRVIIRDLRRIHEQGHKSKSSDSRRKFSIPSIYI